MWKHHLSIAFVGGLCLLFLAACATPAQDTPVATVAPTAAPAVVEAAAPTPTSTPAPTPVPTDTPVPAPVFRSQTSGRVIEEGTPSRPVLMSIENSDGAKPQTGLMEADVIYEFVVESLITRFQVLYNDQYPVYAGPFRSARYYFMDLAQEWDCMYLHEGYGPPEGKYHYKILARDKKIALYPRKGASAFNGYSVTFDRARGAYNDYTVKNGYRFRSADREAPHNLYVLVDKMVYAFYGDHVAADHPRFQFAEEIAYESAARFASVSLPYEHEFNPDFVQFEYHADDNRLYRLENDDRFMVRTPSADGETCTLEWLSVQNLIVQHARYGYMEGDDKGRRTCDLTGSGKCDYFIGGQHVTGTWSRPTLSDYTTYALDDGSTVTLLPGNTWIAVHPDDSAITVQ